MNRGAFQERSGRVIALGRSLLALFFLGAISLEPSNPSPVPSGTYPLLGAYAAFALLYLLLTWNNWWLESRLGGAAHVIDLVALALLNLVTKGYASPFFTFFVFLVLSASIRWGWRETALTAAAITILYLVEGVASSSWGTDSFHFRRFVIRSSYLIVLSSMVILWYASNQRAGRFAPMLASRRKDVPTEA